MHHRLGDLFLSPDPPHDLEQEGLRRPFVFVGLRGSVVVAACPGDAQCSRGDVEFLVGQSGFVLVLSSARQSDVW